ncbi:ABC-type uncharacterized transport system, permease component [Nitrosomonas sp. PY1]|nr:ABC-type uncharacterized transport system, permease component [Nitrosomonas sp. PY1]
MPIPIILTDLITFLLYAFIGTYFWQNKWKKTQTPDLNPENNNPKSAINDWMHYGLIIPLALHAWILYQSILADEGLRFGLGNAVSLIVWLTAFIYWILSFFHRLQGLQVLIAPIAVVAATAILLPFVFPYSRVLENTEFPAFKAHLLGAMLAYSLLTIAAFHAILMMVVERHLHHPAGHLALANLPPLLVMEQLLFRIIGAGFILLTLTLISGIFFSTEVFGQPFTFTHKTFFGVISWSVFAALLAGRQVYGWRGRIAIRWTLTGFMILLLAYIGSKFVLEIILNR